MSFLSYKQIQIKTIPQQHYGKEIDPFIARNKKFYSLTSSERASSFASKKVLQASITLEAAISSMLFFFAILSVCSLFEIMMLQLSVKNAMHSVGKEIAAEAYWNPYVSERRLEEELVEALGKERLDSSLIVGGSSGLDCSGSKAYAGSTIRDFCVCYKIEIPIAFFRIPIIEREEQIRIKGWSGKEDSYVGYVKSDVVYVTEHGMVYHQNQTCTYLELSIKAIAYNQIEEFRNESGGKYSPCKRCRDNCDAMEKVYITGQGDRYHSTLECSSLKRVVYAVPFKDVYGLGGCSKCVE